MGDMPLDVIEKIVKSLNLLDKLLVRHVCKNFRLIIDNSLPPFETVQLNFWKNYVHLKIDGCCRAYCAKNHATSYYRSFGKHVTIHNDPWKFAIIDVELLINPKIQRLKRLEIDVEHPDFSKYFKSIFEKHPGEQIHVESVLITIRNYGDEMAIVPFLEPWTLKRMLVDMNGCPDGIFIKDKLMPFLKLEQCQNDLRIKNSVRMEEFPLECLQFYSRLTLDFQSPTISEFGKLKNLLLSSEKTTMLRLNFHDCFFSRQAEEIKQQFGKSAVEVDGVVANPWRFENRFFHIPIEGTDQFWHVEIEQRCVRFNRKNY